MCFKFGVAQVPDMERCECYCLQQFWPQRERTDKDLRQGGEDGGDAGEEVVKYSGRGVDTMGEGEKEKGEGEGKRKDKEGSRKGICEKLKAAECG